MRANLKITGQEGRRTAYLTIRDDRVQLFSGDGTPLALSNFFNGQAIPLTLLLQECRSVGEAIGHCERLSPKYSDGRPTVTAEPFPHSR